MVYYKEDTVDSNDKDDKGYIKSVSTATKTYYVDDTTNYYIKTAVARVYNLSILMIILSGR